MIVSADTGSHSSEDTVRASINAMVPYANVKWYTKGSTSHNDYDKDGKQSEGTKLSSNFSFTSGNHYAHTKFAQTLYNELVTNKKADGSRKYDLIVLEFDASLIEYSGNYSGTVTQSNYKDIDTSKISTTQLQELKNALTTYYNEGRVVWVVPPDSSTTCPDHFPYTSRSSGTFNYYVLNGYNYTCPNQQDYSNATKLKDYLTTYVLNYYGRTTFTDTVADGLTVTSVVPQYQDSTGKWVNVAPGSIDASGVVTGGTEEDTYHTKIFANIVKDGKGTGTDARKVVVEFNTTRPELAASKQTGKTWSHDLRVLINCGATKFIQKITSGGKPLPTNDGKAKITFDDPKGEYEDLEITLEQESPKLDMPPQVSTIADKVYKGSAWEPADEVVVKVKVDGSTKTLTKGTDYDITWENNTNVSTADNKAVAHVTLKGSYSGVLDVPFNILAVDVPKDQEKQPSSQRITIKPIEAKTYTGSGIEPTDDVIVKDGAKVLELGTDYDIVGYERNIDVTTALEKAIVKLSFKGNYKGDVDVPFDIRPKDVDEDQQKPNPDVSIGNIPDQYCDKPIKSEPKVLVKDRETVLEEGKDYYLTYRDNEKVGKATAIVHFIGNYKGTAEVPFNIIHKDVIFITGKAPQVEIAGWKDYYYCTNCDKFFEDPDCTIAIDDLEAWKVGRGRLDPLPKAGDASINPFWAVLMSIAAAGAGAVLVVDRKKKAK